METRNDHDEFVDSMYSEYRSDAGGEGSRGGKIIGHTSSGKARVRYSWSFGS